MEKYAPIGRQADFRRDIVLTISMLKNTLFYQLREGKSTCYEGIELLRTIRYLNIIYLCRSIQISSQ